MPQRFPSQHPIAKNRCAAFFVSPVAPVSETIFPTVALSLVMMRPPWHLAPALKIKLSAAEKALIAGGGTKNVDAHDFFLRGREMMFGNKLDREAFEQSYSKATDVNIRHTEVRPRERLINAAYDLFSKDGVSRVGIDTILAKSDCAKASLYSNFKTKVELAIAFLDKREAVWTRGWLESRICISAGG
jgi:Bacterial regulatory proteins, tetR family